MAADQRIFRVLTSVEDERPIMTYDIDANRAVDWLRIDDITKGRRPFDDYEPIDIEVHAPDALEWDFYQIAGAVGLASPRARRVLQPLSRGRMVFLPATLNGASYYLLSYPRRLDCLDHDRSALIHFRHAPGRIQDIQAARFKPGYFTDPQLFCIPEDSISMWATPSVPAIFAEAGLRGFRFDDAEKLLC